MKALAFVRVVALNIDPAAVRPADVEVQHLAEVAQLVVRVAAALSSVSRIAVNGMLSP